MKAFAALGLVASAAAQLVSTGASVKLNDIDYFISPFSQGQLSALSIGALPQAFGFTPVTVVADEVDRAELGDYLGSWTSEDDVWQPAFLSAVFLAGANCSKKLSLHEDVETSYVFPLDAELSVPSGPYFLDTASGDLYQAFRLYRDVVSSFTTGLLQLPEGGFMPLSAHVLGADTQTIGVPSRLYYTRTPEKPLAGVRVGVKEIYDIAGMKKSNGNRAWWRLYPAAEATAPAIQNLIDAGAVVVGYQKTSQFANGESATGDWVDYMSPFNPRGDAYNQPSSSSSGAGASIAAYEWLDVAVGSDTGGSVRGPAGAGGLFGNRPSTGLVTLDGVMPLSPTLDTPGLLVRDPEIWHAANKALYGDNYTLFSAEDVKYPTKIYTVSLNRQGAAYDMMNDFVQALTSFVGADGTEEFDINAAWNETGPEEAGGITLSTLLSATYATLITKEQIELVREPFYADYAAAYNGRRPFINPVPLARWGWGDSVPDSWHEDAIRNKTIFMDWFNSEVLAPVDDEAQCSNAILVYPGSTGSPSPRNRYGSAPGAPLGFSTSRWSVFSEAPDNVFPLGEVASPSSITLQDEMLPVAINLMVAKGCDGLLPRLAQDLVKEGVLTVPKAGGTLDGDEILLKRGL